MTSVRLSTFDRPVDALVFRGYLTATCWKWAVFKMWRMILFEMLDQQDLQASS
jgi:hypothetical protein